MSWRGFVWELEVCLEDVDRPELVCQNADVVDDVVSRGIGGRWTVLCLRFSLGGVWEGENELTVVPEDAYGLI